MQAIDTQRASKPLRLTPQQQRVLEALQDRETEKYALSQWYLGALYTLHNEQNPDRIAQAAHSLRELIEKLPRVVLGMGAQGSTSDFAGMRRRIIQHISKDKNRYSKGWLNERIDSALAKTLKKMVRYFELNQQPTRKQRIQTAVAALDPMGNRFDRQTQEKKRDEFNSLWQRLEDFAHHKTCPDLEEFHLCLRDIEKAVFDLLAPISAENQKEIQSILKNTDRSETDVESVFSLIERSGSNYVFFFKHAAETRDTSWLYHLDNRDYFADPQGAEPIGNDRANYPFWWPMHYLASMAPHAPDDVTEIVLRLPKNNNPRIYSEILEIALKLPRNHSAKLQQKILEYARLEHHFLAYRFADLLAFWTERNQTTSALKLAKVLVEFVPDPQDKTKRKRRGEETTEPTAIAAKMAESQLGPSPRIGTREYRKILSKGIRPLAQKEPYKVARLLINATANMICLRTHQVDLDGDVDYSESWCERLSESEGDYENAEKSLVHTLTFACEEVYEKLPDSVIELDITLRKQKGGLFKRLRHYLYSRLPSGITKPWIRQLILEYEDYDLGEYRYEFQRMIRCACECFGESLLNEDERERVFSAICGGQFKENHQAWLKLLGEEFTEEGFNQRQRHFHRMQLRPFAPLLFGDYAAYFRELETEANSPISDEDYAPRKTRAGNVSTRGPHSTEYLESLTDEELLFFINDWDEKENIFEGNHLIEVNIQGLSRTFQTVFKEHIIPDPKRHRFWMENRERIERPIYVEKMIYVLQEYVKANNFDNLDEWLTFSEWVLSHADDSEQGIYDRYAGESRDNPNWSNSRWAVSDFLEACFQKAVNPPVSARAQLANLLEMLCTQFDWRLDRYSTENEPVDASMNTPRCHALEALVSFGLWLRRNDRGSDVSEVIAILEKRMAPEAVYPLALPEYAILGKNYGRLLYLHEAWVTAHKSDFFPQDKFPKWLAAFDNFLGFNSLSKPIFEILQDDFHFAIERLSDFKRQDRPDHKLIDMLGQCLYIFYLEELYPLRGEGSLLEEYYQASDDDREQWANLFDYVGHQLWNATEDLNITEKKRIIDFFEWRFEVGEPVELQRFTYWLKAECLDPQWRLCAYSEILDITKAEDISITIETEALCDMLQDHTQKVVECFAKLTKDIGDNNISIFKEEATAILQAGFRSSEDSVRNNAKRAHENLLRIGRFELLDLDI